MAKEKQTRRMIAMALAAAVTMSSVPVVAFADEVSDTPSVTSESTTTESGDGSMESPRVTVTVTPTETKTTEDGGSVETDKTTTVTTGSDETTGESINKTEVKTETTETSADGAKTETTNTQTDSTEVDADGTTTVTDVEKEETKEYDANGDWVETNGFEEGTETTAKEKTENVPDVTVQLKEGETTSAGGDAETVVEGDVPADENDPEYDYTETTETDRKVTATMGKIETFQSSGNGDANVDAVNPEWTEDKEHVKAPVVFEKYDSLEELQEALKNKPDGYDFLYTGHGEDSLYGVDYGFGGSLHDAGTSTQQFQLTDFSDPNALNGVTDEALRENLDIHTGYCVDLDTESQKGYWYEIENLEDAGYYKTQEAEDHIRAIVMNGYWGTVGTEKDADGNDVPKTGSLDAMKEMLKTAQSDGKLSADIDVDSLTEGEALTATQMAIWKYGNPYESEDGIGLTATTLDSAVYHTDRGGWTEWIYSNDGPYDPYGENIYTNELELNGEKMTSEQVAAAKGRINAIYTYLTGLSMTAEEAGTTEIITEEKVAKVDSLSMTVGEKAEGYAENEDDNNDNDVYNVSLSFALVVEPDKDKDDMVVKVVKIAPDGSMEAVAKARLAGDDTKDEGFSSVAYDETTGSYTLSGLELAENANCEFNLKLEGAQYLEQGVYIYSSEIKNEKSSQTFVGIAEGYKSVDVGMKVDLNFDVKEGTITEKRSYRKVSHDEPTTEPGGDTSPGGGGGGDNPGGNTPDPETDIPEEDVPLAGVEDPVEDIGESDVPLAEDPMVAGEEEIIAATGDSNHMAAAFGGMLMALAGLFGLRKKEN